MKLPEAGTTDTGVVQLSALSQAAAFSDPPGRVSHWEMTTLMAPPAAGSFHTTYRRPKVGLEEELSIVIIGLSCVPAVRAGRPVVCAWKVVAPGAKRLTTMRLGFPAPLA